MSTLSKLAIVGLVGLALAVATAVLSSRHQAAPVGEAPATSAADAR